MARVGCDSLDRLLSAVESVSVITHVFAPEPVFESLLQVGGFFPQPGRPLSLAEVFVSISRPKLGVEYVALKLTQRFRSFDQRAIRVDDSLACVLPCHIFVPSYRPSLILLKAVAVQVTVLIHPFQALQRYSTITGQEHIVAEPFPRLVERDDVKTCGVGGAIVR